MQSYVLVEKQLPDHQGTKPKRVKTIQSDTQNHSIVRSKTVSNLEPPAHNYEVQDRANIGQLR